MPHSAEQEPLLTRASGKIVRRLIPFLMLCYFAAYLDRVNVGFAALTMNADLGFSAELFGFGAGIFFAGYFLFEVPSNLLLERFGARAWIARIMVTWGVLAAGMAFVSGPTSFCVMRFLLGVAEAGFFPGIILYLTYWFTAEERARWIGVFMTAIPLSSVIGGPVSGWILDHLNGAYGLAGWQWLFLIEGLPSIAIGLACLVCLDDGPAQAAWLDRDERDALLGRLAAERQHREAVHTFTLREALTNRRVLALSLVYFGIVSGNYGLGYWLPSIVADVARSAGLDTATGIRLNTLTGCARGGPVRARGGRDDRVDAALRPHGRARVARRRTGDPRRRRTRGRGAARRSAGRRARADARRGLHLRRAADVLDAAHGVPHRHRGGRRHRAGELDRQSRRLRRAVSARLAQGVDRLSECGPDGARGLLCDGGRRHRIARPRHDGGADRYGQLCATARQRSIW